MSTCIKIFYCINMKKWGGHSFSRCDDAKFRNNSHQEKGEQRKLV